MHIKTLISIGVCVNGYIIFEAVGQKKRGGISPPLLSDLHFPLVRYYGCSVSLMVDCRALPFSVCF